MNAYVPSGWPPGVHPPGSEDFERTAQAWLLDTVPADYRLHGVLRRYPLALAAMAAHHTQACVAGARDGYRTARTELGDVLPPHALEAVLAAYRAEGRRLVATAHAVDLVARALRGEVFTPQLRDAAPPGDRRAGPGPAGQPGTRHRAAAAGAQDGPGTAAGREAAVPAAAVQEAAPPSAGRSTASPATRDELSARRTPAGADGESPPGRTDGRADGRTARDGAAKARKAQAAQRPARDGGTARRKSRPSDKHAAAG